MCPLTILEPYWLIRAFSYAEAAAGILIRAVIRRFNALIADARNLADRRNRILLHRILDRKQLNANLQCHNVSS